MTSTRASHIVIIAAIGAGLGWLLEVGLVAAGHPVLIPPVTLAAALGLIGVIVVLLALPVYRVVKGTAKSAIDPFYATRVVLLAKASSITGSLIGGFAAAGLVFLLSRTVVAGVGSITMAAATLVGAVILLIGGLVAEKMCTLPPDDEEKTGGTTAIQ